LKNVRYVLACALTSLSLLPAGFVHAQNANLSSGFASLAQNCMVDTRENCLGNLQLMLERDFAEMPQELLNENLGLLVLALVNALQESFSDDVFITVAIALRTIARFGDSPEFAMTVLEIAEIIERRDLLVIAPELLFASPS